MSYLAYFAKTRPTGKKLAEALGFTHFGVTPPSDTDLLLRWGNAKRAPRGEPGTCINQAAAIWSAGDKYTSLQKLSEAGIRVPDHSLNPPPLGGDTWLVRSRRGFGGKDILIHDGAARGEWYSKFIPNDREYRIHVVNGEVIRVQRKYLEHPDKRTSEHIKNHDNGYVFKAPQKTLNKSRLEAAVKAVEALGLDFGAVDLVIDHNGLEYVLEVNTAPACSPLTLSAYVEAFKKHFPQIGGGNASPVAASDRPASPPDPPKPEPPAVPAVQPVREPLVDPACRCRGCVLR